MTRNTNLIKNWTPESIKEILNSNNSYKEGMKLFAAYLASKGWSARKMESLFDVSFKQITIWLHEFDEFGESGLKEKPKTGRNSKMDDEQKSLLKHIIENQLPTDFGIDDSKWKGDAVAALIEQKFGIAYKKAQVYNIINSLNISVAE
jgi:transposase